MILPSSEYEYLQELYEATNGIYWKKNRNWNFQDRSLNNPCQQKWDGLSVVKTKVDCRISFINLPSNNLTGTLPPVLSDFEALAYFYVNDNHIRGSLPLFHNNSKLSTVYLFNNKFEGCIPADLFDIITAQTITDLNLFNCSLTGKLPEALSLLIKLQNVKFNNNNFNGPIPFSFSNLKQIQSFNVGFNQFTGEIFSVVNPIKALNSFTCDGNSFQGSIPESFFDTHSITVFSIQNNQFTGTIPSSVSPTKVFRMFNYFLVSGNKFSGTLPDWLCRSSDSINIDVHNNQFSGTIPSCIAKLKLQEFLIHQNKFTGDFGILFASSSSFRFIEHLSISYNRFSGSVPSAIFNRKLLKSFSAVENCFHGSLSDDICNGTSSSIEVLSMSGLGASSSCNSYPFLFPSYTSSKMEGTIPPCLWTLPHLKAFYLSGNHFTGSIHLQNGSLSPSLMKLSLSHNYFTGSVPIQIQEHPFAVLDLSYNKFKGNIESMNYIKTPVDYSLNLTHNRLSGEIPADFQHVTNLEILFGNLFSCSSTLPSNDPYYKSYFCGSSQFNNSSYAFLFVVGIVAFLIVIYRIFKLLKSRNTTNSENSSVSTIETSPVNFMKRLYTVFPFVPILFRSEIIEFHRYVPPNHEDDFRNILKFVSTITKIIHLVTILGISIVVLLLPSYCGLNAYVSFRKYENQYSWNLTSTYLTGLLPSIILTLLWLLLFIFPVIYIIVIHRFDDFSQETILSKIKESGLCSCFTRIYRRTTRKNPSSFVGEERIKDNDELFETDDNDLVNSLLTSNQDSSSKKRNSQSRNNHLSSLDFPSMSANITNNPDSNSEQIPRILFYHYYFLLFFAVVVNFACSFTLNYFYLQYLSINEGDNVDKYLVQIGVAIFKLFWNFFIIAWIVNFIPLQFYFVKTGQITRFHIFLLVINTIIAPVSAAVVTDAACFKELFQKPQELTGFETLQCFIPNVGVQSCELELNPSLSISLPFMYYSTCGSEILTSYIPIFMYTYTILPVINSCYVIVLSVTPLKMIPKVFYPKIRGLLRPADFPLHVFPSLVKGDRIMAMLILHIIVLLTFGINSPVLAIAITLSILLECFILKINIKRFIEHGGNGSKEVGGFSSSNTSSNINGEQSAGMEEISEQFESEQQHEKIKELNRALSDSWFCFYQSRWVIFYYAILFSCFILFDYASDQIGFLYALWMPITMICFLLMMRLFLSDVIFAFRSYSQKGYAFLSFSNNEL
jgi:hypothetical protein